MRRVIGIISTVGAALAFLGFAALPGAATMIRHMSLTEVTRSAATVVHAAVVDVHSGRDAAGLPATWVTLNVARSVKGGARGPMIIKQYGVAEPLPDGTVTRIAGLPQYRIGEEVVLFLHRDSQLGFTSPVGLGQGCYRVQRTATQRLVREDLRNAAPLDLDEFLSKVERLAAAAQ